MRRARAARSATPLAPAGRSLCAASCRGALVRPPASNCARLDDLVDEAPLDGALAADALGDRAEDVGEVAAHLALVDDAREAAGAGQHAEQRRLGQADRAGAVVDQDDLVAGERELVAAAGADAVERGEELEAAVLRRSPRCRGASRW